MESDIAGDIDYYYIVYLANSTGDFDGVLLCWLHGSCSYFGQPWARWDVIVVELAGLPRLLSCCFILFDSLGL